MSIIFPEATKSFGNTATAIVTGTLTKAAPAVATQIKAASTSLTVSMYLYGVLDATSETAKGVSPPRSGETSEREQEGRTKFSITDIEYVHDPQGASSDEPNKARTLLAKGTECWLVERQGLSAEDLDWVAGQKVNLHHVRVGEQRRSRTGDDEFAEFSIKQSVSYIEDPIYDVVTVT